MSEYSPEKKEWYRMEPKWFKDNLKLLLRLESHSYHILSDGNICFIMDNGESSLGSHLLLF